MSVLKKFLGQTAIYGLSTVFSRLFNFILTPIYTGKFAAGTYGIFTTMYAYASMINAVLAFGMESTYFRYLNKHEDKKQEVYNNSFLCIAFISVLFLVTGLVFSNPIANYLTDDPKQLADYKSYVQYFIWILFVDAICVIPFAKLRADNKAFKYSLIKFMNIGCFVGFNLLFIYVIPLMIKHQWPMGEWFASWYRGIWVGYVFIANLIASLVTFVLLLPEFLKIQLKFDKELFGKMFSYSWPILVANLSFIVNENLDKIVLSRLLPDSIADHEVGIYGAVCKIAIFISIFITAFRLGAEPFFFSHAKNANAKKTYATILHYFVIALAVLFVGLIANIELLKHFIRKEEYWVGLPAVPYLLFGYVCLGIYMNLSIWYRLSDQTRFGLYISIVGASITILLNFVLIPKYSYMGSAWVSMLAYFVMMVISYVLGQKYYPIPYNLKRILSYLIISVILVILSFWVFNRNIYIGNAMLLVFIAGIAYLEKDELKVILFKK
ncbi:Membrane protein involved in the export of O-antigen and teichoic acid [Pedobacter steynii]|uniref:Membrane protein involved in the export of O-antigen and teichoic acid n=1 Tax=Pedobacter steynii TaxID=430522 RepID=A0A1G9WPF3_9SPHI|nr:polysaccharide biosynthesis C-terminal domain-containing protein [Pedobacter steynii]NQX40356.1 polysaccharide biosynthesis C-terminal domain-containing protein [Pedobacter steynii]SDM86380.1 Membrane protein involved in the export of O-antigen and teichoic acid [Pedobacter steynii]